MSKVSENLPGLLGNLTRNREQVEINRKKIRQALTQLDDASLASIKQLVDKFEHAQSVTQFVNAYVQSEQLDKAADEMDAAIAVVQIAMDDSGVAELADVQAAANDEARNSPLPAAGQAVASAPADQGSGAAVAEEDTAASA